MHYPGTALYVTTHTHTHARMHAHTYILFPPIHLNMLKTKFHELSEEVRFHAVTYTGISMKLLI